MIALASVRDSYENIARFLEGGFGDELAALHYHMWRQKAIKVSLNGDYDFCCKVYGFSGPQGTFFVSVVFNTKALYEQYRQSHLHHKNIRHTDR